MAAGSRERKRKRKSGGALYGTLAAALVVLAVITGLGIFFKVSDTVVTGSSIYSADKIVEASGIEQGDSIFFLKESSLAIKIKKALPYIDEVRIVRSLPDIVTIVITESVPVASVKSGSAYWIVDKNAKVLEKTDAAGVEDTIELRGVSPIMPSEGGTLALGDAEHVKLMYLKAVLNAIVDKSLADHITWLDMTNISSISFDYDGYEVKIGKGENLEDKLWLFEKFLETRGQGERGEVDLSIDGEAHFDPD